MTATLPTVTVCVIVILTKAQSASTGRYRQSEDQESDDYDMELYDDSDIFDSDDNNRDSQSDIFELPFESDGSELVEMDKTNEEFETDESDRVESDGDINSRNDDDPDNASNKEQFSNTSSGIVIIDESVSSKRPISKAKTESHRLPRSQADLGEKEQEKSEYRTHETVNFKQTLLSDEQIESLEPQGHMTNRPRRQDRLDHSRYRRRIP